MTAPRLWLLLPLAALGVVSAVRGQQPSPAATGEFELAAGLDFPKATQAELARLERVKAAVDAGHWPTAVELLAGLSETGAGRLVEAAPGRFVPLQEHCQNWLARLPAAGLAEYRRQIDARARAWYDEAINRLDAAGLRRVVEQAFASSYGDDALLALGELALQAGDPVAARSWWRRLVPPTVAAPAWPSYPDTSIDAAAVRARLVLTSIVEGDLERAAGELAVFVRLHPDARGRLGGKEAVYAEGLQLLLNQSGQWADTATPPEWRELAGGPDRHGRFPRRLDPAAVVWRSPLAGTPRAPSVHNAASPFFPVAAEGLIFAATATRVFAWEAATGRPAWNAAEAAIYRDPLEPVGGPPSLPADLLGRPCYTLAIAGQRLLTRVGSPLTGGSDRATQAAASHLVCLDLRRQGALVWKFTADDGFSIEGAPVFDGADAYVAMRRGDVRPQAHVACLDGQSGRLRWRQFVCAAETPARSHLAEATHNMLTLVGATLYFNTNLGAVAALNCGDGRLCWLAAYPRAKGGDLARLAPHWQRTANPCLYHRGVVLAAPADSPRVFAFEADSGRRLWQSGAETAEIDHLLGVAGHYLLAGGGRLHWISLREAEQGRVVRVWPTSDERPGRGRGLLAADAVYFPAREAIWCFDAQSGEIRKRIGLAARGAAGGNLAALGERVAIATDKELIILGEAAGGPAAPARLSHLRLSPSGRPMPCLTSATLKP